MYTNDTANSTMCGIIFFSPDLENNTQRIKPVISSFIACGRNEIFCYQVIHFIHQFSSILNITFSYISAPSSPDMQHLKVSNEQRRNALSTFRDVHVGREITPIKETGKYSRPHLLVALQV